MLLRAVIFSLWWKFLAADSPLCTAEDGVKFRLFNSSLTFRLPEGLHRVRVLAVGGGGAGCDGLVYAKAQASLPVVDVIHVRGPAEINVTVGRGGTKTGAGMPSSFGKVTSMGGAGCETDYSRSSWEVIRGIQRFHLNTITRGADGSDRGGGTKYGAGGKGGVLISGEGPVASPGSHSTSGQGGRGYGAGGGSGGVSPSDTPYTGGNGAPGTVYIETTQAGCQEEVNVIFAVEGLKFEERYERQLRFVRHLFSVLHQTKNRSIDAQVGLIVYRNNASLIFPPGYHKNTISLKSATLKAENPFNDSSEVNFSQLLETVHLAFANSSDERRLRSLVVFTYSRNVIATKKLQEYKKQLLNLNVSITVVGLAWDATPGDLANLTKDLNHVLVTKKNSSDLNPLSPWILDLICQDAFVERNSAASMATVAPSPCSSGIQSKPPVMSSITALDVLPSKSLPNKASKVSIFGVTQVTGYISTQIPSASFSTHNLNTPIHIGRMTSSLPVTVITHAISHVIRPTSVTASLRSSTVALLTTKEPRRKKATQQELARDLRSILTFNLSAININDVAALKRFMDLVGNILSHRLEVGNTTKELPAFQVLKNVEKFALTLASQLSPHHSTRGVARFELKSKATTLSVCALNVTGTKRLSLRDLESGNEANGTEDIIMPASVFSNVNNGMGHAMMLAYNAIDEMNAPNDTAVRSKVIKVVVKPKTNPPFETPVEMTFPIGEAKHLHALSQSQHLEEENKCAFWDSNKRTAQRPYGWWSDKGCLIVRSNRTHVTCHCDHLTNFAVITRVKNYERSDEVEFSLSIISYVGISLSLLGCVLTILTHAFLPSLRSDRTVIHVNLVVAIFFSQILFLISPRVRETKKLCLSTAVIAYYFYMCVFTWMLVEGVHIYAKVVKVFQENHSRKKTYFLFGWGAPVIATIVSAGAYRKSFVSDRTCWLNVENRAIFTFIGPVVFVILVNIIVLCMVMRVTARMFKNDVNASARALVKGFVALLPILGLTWLFGILAVNSATIVFEYIFAIFNSLQGFLIFLFCCVTNTEVRREFKRKVRNMRASRNPRSSYSLSHSGRGLQNSHNHGRHSEMKNLTRDKL